MSFLNAGQRVPMTQHTTEQLATWGDRTAGRATGLQRFVAGWAAFGITLSGATQLRPEGPIGPSEAILAGWMAFVIFLLLRGVHFAKSRVFAVLRSYWLAQLAVLGMGGAIGVYTHRSTLVDAIHDGFAFIYLAFLTTLLTLRLYDEDEYEYHWTFARLIFVFHALAAGLLLAVGLAVPAIGPVRFWYGGIRFAGWAHNPNQMALAMVAMPFLGWWLMRRASGWFGKAGYLIGIALCAAAGFATQSDGMRVAWAGSAGAIYALLLYRVTLRGRSRWLYVSHLIVPALVVVVGISFGEQIVTSLAGVADDIYADRDQGEKRFTLWLHGLQAIRELPLLGFGPGPFSGTLVPFGSREAHNSFIDWGMSTGAIGVAIYISLLAWVASRALRSGEAMPVAMFISVVSASVFGYLLRQPDFWLVMVLVLILSEHSILVRYRQASQSVFQQRPYAWEPAARFDQKTLR